MMPPVRPPSPLLLAGWMTLAACGGGAGNGRPNVILVSIDSLRADHVGCYGYDRQTTPNLDRFAAEGARFEQHMSSSSWTLPAHAAMFTSVSDSVHGCVEATGTALNPAFTTLAESFQQAGYATGGFYGGPYLHAAFGLGQGFDEYKYCVESQAGTFEADQVASWANDSNKQERTHTGVTNPLVYGAARDWMEDHDGAPFFAFVHFWDVHYDFTPPAPWDTRFDPAYEGPIDGRHFFRDNVTYNPRMSRRDLVHLKALYDGEIGWTDTFLGKLRADLEAWGLAENTILAITSDHGTEFFDHGLKGHRQTLFDEVVHVPFVLWAPGRIDGGRVVEQQTRVIDLGPTLLELADIPGREGVMGESLVTLAKGGELDFDNTAVCELFSVGRSLRAVRVQGGKFLRDEAEGARVPARWYDLGADPREKSPSTDFDTGRGAELQAAYGKALRKLSEAIATRPGDSVPTDLSDEVRAELAGNGYIGGDQDD
jgi:arylsulfatase A-like enzyme